MATRSAQLLIHNLQSGYPKSSTHLTPDIVVTVLSAIFPQSCPEGQKGLHTLLLGLPWPPTPQPLQEEGLATEAGATLAVGEHRLSSRTLGCVVTESKDHT